MSEMVETRAQKISQQLAGEFLRNGNFDAARAAMDSNTVAGILPSTAGQEFAHFTQYGFENLSVQSVGYASGADEEFIHVYVTRGNRRDLSKLSTDVEGIKVQIVNLGKLAVRPEAAAVLGVRGNVYERNGRIACGSSCAPAGENYSGTFGALVDSDGDLMALSNNHVFAACNHVIVGQPILSPSSSDARPNVPAPRQLCRHARIVELRSGTPALVPLMSSDAATASVPNDDTVTSWQGDVSSGFDTPSMTVPPTYGQRVKKVGRTTGVTFGVVESLIFAPMPLPYKTRYFTATVWFTNVWSVRADEGDHFALPGDSGSLVVTEGGEAAVGLLFACSGKGDYGFIAPIQTVLSDLNLSLVSNHNI